MLASRLAFSPWTTSLAALVGQPGKDVVWMPSPQSVVEKMLAMAEVTARDTVVDLGSGDGRSCTPTSSRRTSRTPPWWRCSSLWCSALLWIVPAQVAGAYDTPLGPVTLNQRSQMLTGVLRAGGRMLDRMHQSSRVLG